MKRRTLLLASAALAGVGRAIAQDRTTIIVLPYAPGGSLDLGARVLAQELRVILGRNFVIQNKPGANSLIGAKFVQAAPKDGSVLLYQGPNIVTVAAQKNPEYDAFKDFTPLGNFTRVEYFLSATAPANVTTVADFIRYARSRPEGIFAGNAGAGSLGHMLAAAFANNAGIKVTHVPYKGAAEVIRALGAGEIQMQLSTTSSPLDALVQAGKVKYLGTASPKASPFFPNVPPIRDSLPSMLTLDSWNALFGPAGMPADVVSELTEGIRKATLKPEVAKGLAGQFMSPHFVDGPSLTRLMVAAGTDQERLRKESGITE